MINRKYNNIMNLIGFIFLIYASSKVDQIESILNYNKIKPAFMPASYSLIIWSVIYTLLFIWIIKGFTATPKESIVYKKVGLWSSISMIFTGIAFIMPIKITPLFIIIALISSFITYYKINFSCIHKIYILPFSLICGWLCITTIYDVSLFLKLIGVDSFLWIGEVGCTSIVLVVLTIIAIFFTLLHDDVNFALMFIWGYIAIALDSQSNMIIRTSFTMCIVLIISILYNLYIQRFNYIKLKKGVK